MAITGMFRLLVEVQLFRSEPFPNMIVRGNALRLPLPDESVDLIVTSPPYWALRSYQDGGKHYDSQIGSEDTPQEWLEAMWEVLKECWRVLKPEGVCFVNIGDKRAGSGGHNNAGLATGGTARSTLKSPKMQEQMIEHAHTVNKNRVTRRDSPDYYKQTKMARRKSKLLLPHRFAIGCMEGKADPEGIGWIISQDLVWSKVNGMPESVIDRTRDSHEYVFHLAKIENFYSAVTEIREPLVTEPEMRDRSIEGTGGNMGYFDRFSAGERDWHSPAGRLPPSVWPLPSEPSPPVAYETPLGWLSAKDTWKVALKWQGPDFNVTPVPKHFAAFPTELVRKIILGWSPNCICSKCGEGRRPATNERLIVDHRGSIGTRGEKRLHQADPGIRVRPLNVYGSSEVTVIGYVCSCTPYTDHPGEKIHEPGAVSWNKGYDLEGKAYSDNGRKKTFGKAPSQRENPRSEQAGGSRALPEQWKDDLPPPPSGPWREYHLDGWTPPPSVPAVVVDPFGGSGTTAFVANALGRRAMSVDLSSDYCRLAKWRTGKPASKVLSRTWKERQNSLV